MSAHDITLKIDGMTCGHCVSSVTEEISAVAGVNSVSVDLTAGGTSTATVFADDGISNSALEAAVAEAGYTLVSLDV